MSSRLWRARPAAASRALRTPARPRPPGSCSRCQPSLIVQIPCTITLQCTSPQNTLRTQDPVISKKLFKKRQTPQKGEPTSCVHVLSYLRRTTSQIYMVLSLPFSARSSHILNFYMYTKSKNAFSTGNRPVLVRRGPGNLAKRQHLMCV